MYKVLMVGCGNMGSSHALAFSNILECTIVGLVALSSPRREKLAQKLSKSVNQYSDYFTALEETKPDIVCIATYSETHAAYAIAAIKNGAHVFLEKPIATNLNDAYEVAKTASQFNKKLVIGLILRHHPSWQKFISIAHTLGTPLVMRMNLNQQSYAQRWQTHCLMMQSMSPLVECGVHYVDVMCQMTQAKPIKVHAVGAKLSNQVNVNNYGILQVVFADGSVGWYEAGWGPMMSTNAYFIKDVIGPNGCASILPNTNNLKNSSNISSHTATENILLHKSKLDNTGNFITKDELICLEDEPDHNQLCLREQQFLLNAIIHDIDLSQHIQDAIDSLKIVLAAEESIKTGNVILLH